MELFAQSTSFPVLILMEGKVETSSQRGLQAPPHFEQCLRAFVTSFAMHYFVASKLSRCKQSNATTCHSSVEIVCEIYLLPRVEGDLSWATTRESRGQEGS